MKSTHPEGMRRDKRGFGRKKSRLWMTLLIFFTILSHCSNKHKNLDFSKTLALRKVLGLKGFLLFENEF